jgi:hypothetical protein
MTRPFSVHEQPSGMAQHNLARPCRTNYAVFVPESGADACWKYFVRSRLAGMRPVDHNLQIEGLRKAGLTRLLSMSAFGP